MGYWEIVDSIRLDNVYQGSIIPVVRCNIISMWGDNHYQIEFGTVSKKEKIYKGDIGYQYKAEYVGMVNRTEDKIEEYVKVQTGVAINLGDYKSELLWRYTYYEGDINLLRYVPTPPSTPSSITAPLQVKEGEKISISWGSGSYASGYCLERSINGGSYSQIYSGSSRVYTDTALSSWDTVRYRVRSYNGDGYSSYRTSDTVMVTHFPEMGFKVSGALKVSEMGWVKVNGVLREIDSIHIKVNGALKEVE